MSPSWPRLAHKKDDTLYVDGDIPFASHFYNVFFPNWSSFVFILSNCIPQNEETCHQIFEEQVGQRYISCDLLTVLFFFKKWIGSKTIRRKEKNVRKKKEEKKQEEEEDEEEEKEEKKKEKKKKKKKVMKKNNTNNNKKKKKNEKKKRTTWKKKKQVEQSSDNRCVLAICPCTCL